MNEPLFTLPLGSWVETFVDWLTDTFAVIFTFIKTVLEGLYDALDLVLGGPPPLLIAVVLALLAFFAKGWKLAVGTLVRMLVIQSVGQWSDAMDSLALALLSPLIAHHMSITVTCADR